MPISKQKKNVPTGSRVQSQHVEEDHVGDSQSQQQAQHDLPPSMVRFLDSFKTLQENMFKAMQENTKTMNETLATNTQTMKEAISTIQKLIPATTNNTQTQGNNIQLTLPAGGATDTRRNEENVEGDPEDIGEDDEDLMPELEDSQAENGLQNKTHHVSVPTTQTQLAGSRSDPTSKSKASRPNNQSTYLTVQDLEKYLEQKQQTSSLSMLDLKLPYPTQIALKPYPKDYVSPKFKLFNGKQGDAKEHMMKFIETLGVYGLDDDLKLKEFSKSLTDKAYTWYVNLTPGSVTSWGMMCKLFLEKFFSTQEKVTMSDLGRERQRSKEGLMEYIERFRERTLDIQVPFDEKEAVKVCIQGMFREYRVHLENLKISSFATLVEDARRTNNTLSSQRNDNNRSDRRGPSVNSVEVENSKSNKRPRSDVSGDNPEPPQFPCPMHKVHAILDQWIKDGNIKLPDIEQQPTNEDKTNPKFCRFHRRVGHPTRQCRNLRRIFQKRQQNGELFLEQEDVRKNPFPAHNGRQAHTNAIVHDPLNDDAIVGTTTNQDHVSDQQVEEVVDSSIAKALMKTINFRAFFDQLGFNEEGKEAAAVALVQISKTQYGECNMVSQPMGKIAKSHESAIIFTQADMCAKNPNHNRPLYVESILNGYTTRRTFVDDGSSVNIMPISTFRAANIKEEHLIKQPISIQGFNNTAVQTLGYVNADFKVGPIRGSTRFHVIDVPVSYHLLIGRKWLHEHNLVPSSLYQCIKGY